MPAIREKTGECRQCRAFCDKMIEPRGCVELGCRYLYSFVDALTGLGEQLARARRDYLHTRTAVDQLVGEE